MAKTTEIVDGVEVQHRDRRPFMEREMGKADGLSRDYVWNKGNKHTATMERADAIKLATFDDGHEWKFPADLQPDIIAEETAEADGEGE